MVDNMIISYQCSLGEIIGVLHWAHAEERPSGVFFFFDPRRCVIEGVALFDRQDTRYQWVWAESDRKSPRWNQLEDRDSGATH